ncbi:MAG: hypothetical protein MJY71_07955, partial [Bacteroidaceae bacterium]|nr:hypothetical protein [Bacteroidaceae bacterium]
MKLFVELHLGFVHFKLNLALNRTVVLTDVLVNLGADLTDYLICDCSSLRLNDYLCECLFEQAHVVVHLLDALDRLNRSGFNYHLFHN